MVIVKITFLETDTARQGAGHTGELVGAEVKASEVAKIVDGVGNFLDPEVVALSLIKEQTRKITSIPVSNRDQKFQTLNFKETLTQTGEKVLTDIQSFKVSEKRE